MASTTSKPTSPLAVITAVIGAALIGVLFYLRSIEVGWYVLLALIAAYLVAAFFVLRRDGGFGGVSNPKDFYTGILLLGACGVFAAGLVELPLGRVARPGPGFFPLMLLSLLFIFSIAILINGLRTKGEALTPVPWRGLIIITGMTVFFGATIKGLGFIPAIVVTAFVSCLATRHWTLVSAFATAAILAVFSWAIFIWGLGLPIALCGSWLRALLISLGVAGESIPFCY
ncbi:MAG: tripartite tricarboxylate transporter TctB family protein [Xanthobacteraceae bacterium]|jgi:putative tricarboxylic transport membrane protein|nr:tripartite tricarboxylate transporter TctB family protein [Xanthobacteraceae bacterium]